ncbi:hypothetical protein V6N13_036058 [Hibiscus sabdariffa]
MALQAPTTLPLKPNAGLWPPVDRFALKSPFFSPSLHLLLPSRLPTATASASTAPRFSMRVASKQAYICLCGAPKRRFKPYQPAVARNANDKDVRKARKEQMKRDEAVGRALPIAIVVGIAALAGLYFYLNSTIGG